MKKGIAVVSAIAVLAVAGTFVVNKVMNEKTENETTTAYVQAEKEDYNDSSDYEYEKTSVETTTEEETQKAEIKTAEELFNEIKSFPYGTAGSSAKALLIAVDMINFAENTDESDAVITEKIEELKRDMSDARYEEYLDNLYAINEYVKDLYDNKNPDFFESTDYKIETEDGKFSIDNYMKYFKLFGGE